MDITDIEQLEEMQRVDKVPTLREVIFDYNRLRPLKESTKHATEVRLKRTVPDWLDLDISAVKKRMIIERHAELSNKNGPRGKGTAEANLTMRVLKALFNFAIHFYEDANGQPLLTFNPVNQLKNLKLWHKAKRRTSVIRRGDLPAWFSALHELCEKPQQNYVAEKYPDRPFVIRDYLSFLWLTGCRRTEAATLTWNDVDLKSGFVTFRQTKNGKDHILPLSDYLWDMLKQRRLSVSATHPFVFPGTKANRPISNTSKRINKAVSDLCGVNFMLHDLRRGFASTATGLGIQGHILKSLLNHSTSTDVTSGYICLEPEYLRPYMQAITNTLLGYAGYEPPTMDYSDVLILDMQHERLHSSAS